MTQVELFELVAVTNLPGLTDPYQTVSTINLLCDTAKVEFHGWQTRTPDEESDTTRYIYDTDLTFRNMRAIQESIPIAFSGDPETVKQTIYDVNKFFLEQARLYNSDGVEGTSVYLRWKMPDEMARYGMIYKAALLFPAGNYYSALYGDIPCDNVVVNATLVLLRAPLWENLGLLTIRDTFSGSTDDYGTKVMLDGWGDAPSRIQLMELTDQRPTATARTRSKFWIGIRPCYLGADDYTPVWDVSTASVTPGGGGTTGEPGTTGGGAEIFPGGSGELRMSINDLGLANPEHMAGQYLVLGRWRGTDAGTVRLIMSQGLDVFSNQVINSNEPVYPTTSAPGETYHYAELGYIQFPLGKFSFTPQSDYNYYSLRINAQRISGAGDFHLDSLYLIPSKHMLRLGDFPVFEGGGSKLELITRPAGFDYRLIGYSTASVVPIASKTASPNEWFLPVEGGVMVIATDKPGDEVIEPPPHPIDYLIQVIRRYRIYAV